MATNTLSRSINYASINTRLNPLSNVGTVANEPALTIGDYVRQFILSPPFAWRWNRATTAFLSTNGVQDYTITSWGAAKAIAVGTIIVDSNKNQQQAVIGGNTGGSVPTWNQIPNGSTVDNQVTWINRGIVGFPALASFPFGWLEKATAIDPSGAAHELTVQLNLANEGAANQPFIISPQIDDGDTTNAAVTFRIFPPPEQAYKIVLVFQKSAPRFGSLSDTWAPIPDYFSYLYNQGVLAKAYEYLDDERYGPATQMFVRMVLGANAGLTDTQVNIFLAERLTNQRESQADLANSQGGRTGRGLFNG